MQQPKCWSQKCRLALIRGGCIMGRRERGRRRGGWVGRRSFQDLPARFAQLSRVQTEFNARPLIPTYGPRIAAFTSNCNFDQLLAVLDYFFSFLDCFLGNAVISWSQNIVHCANLFQNVIDPPFCLIFEASFSILVFLSICLLVWKTRSPWKGRRRTLKIMNLTKFSARTRNLRQLNSPLAWNEEELPPMYSYPSHNEENGRMNNKSYRNWLTDWLIK